ncbi:MAG: T9SS type A sorting domain-containing protein [Ignavibacteria bacterium]|nr:T9SS type A sorting domain-containing protein [Ignavibacteria bacterium]HCN38507.1 hypothetical protein [Bacteroidota bacterium]
MKNILFVFLFFVITVNVAISQWTSDSTQNTTIYSGSGDQVLTKVALTSDGGCFISWFDNRGSGYTVRLQRLNAQGIKQFAADGLVVSSNAQSSSLVDYDMIADDSNNAVITFTDVRDGNPIKPYAYKISSTGQFLWGANGITLWSDGVTNQPNPKVAQTSDGSYAFIWVYSSSPRRAQMQKLSRTGDKLWGASGIFISLQGSENVDWPKLVASDAGGIITMYSGYTGSFISPQNYRIYTQKFNSSGVSVWNPTAPDTVYSLGRITGFYNPNIGSDFNNGAVFTWYDDRASTNTGNPYVQRVNSAGVKQFPANGSSGITTGTFLRNQPFSVFVPSTSETYLFWRENNANQSQSGLYAQKFNSAGVRQWSDDGRVFLPLSTEVVTYIWAGARDTNIVCVYTQQTGGATYVTRALKTGPSGVVHWRISVASNPSSKTQMNTQIFRSSTGMVVTGWGDDRAGSSDIFAQNINLNGTLGNPTNINPLNNIIPDKFNLKQNYPNPFNPETKINFSIPAKTFVTLKIYSMTGQEVAELISSDMDAGEYSLNFSGLKLSSGSYVYRLTAGEFTDSKIMTLIK